MAAAQALQSGSRDGAAPGTGATRPVRPPATHRPAGAAHRDVISAALGAAAFDGIS